MDITGMTQAPARALQVALDAVVDELVHLRGLAASTGADVLDLLPRQAAESLAGAADAIGDLVDLVPALTAEIDVVLAELHAQRLSIEAISAELGALDTQLGVLEATLAPVRGWTHRLSQVGSSVSGHLHPVPRPRPGSR
ncbi:MAG: hypothetical protein NTV23_04860 [Propionibacteriales bacterium]|nr:hypothetical protein [Propionibacteriales bacterium]